MTRQLPITFCPEMVKAAKEPVTYLFNWGNNEKRRTLQNRPCRIVAVGKFNSVMVRFLDNGQEEIISRRALRKMIKGKPQ